MNEKEINKHLKNGISEIAPNCFDEIMEKISIKEDIPNSKIASKKWATQKIIRGFASVAACFIIIAGSYSLYQNNNQKVYTIVELDVNPSIEFGVNKSDKVVNVTALNDDGEEILENLSLEKENIKEATLVVMDELVEQGFITQEKSTVLVSVENDNEDKTEEIKQNLSEEIVRHFEKEDIEVTVLKQTIVKDEVSENIAKEYNISKGKALLIKTVMEENSDLSEAELAKMTVDEIAEKTDGKEIIATKAPENDDLEPTVVQEKKEPTETSEKDNKVKPTKVPETDSKVKPTKVPENDNKAKPTNTPENDNKAKPTKAPEKDNKAKPTNMPGNDNKAKPTKVPGNDNKAKPTKVPENDNKAKPTQVPEMTTK